MGDTRENRFSVGTKNKDLKVAADGSLTIYVQADPPTDPIQRANWAARAQGRLLALRACLLAEAGDHRRLVDAAGRESCEVNRHQQAGAVMRARTICLALTLMAVLPIAGGMRA